MFCLQILPSWSSRMVGTLIPETYLEHCTHFSTFPSNRVFPLLTNYPNDVQDAQNSWALWWSSARSIFSCMPIVPSCDFSNEGAISSSHTCLVFTGCLFVRGEVDFVCSFFVPASGAFSDESRIFFLFFSSRVSVFCIHQFQFHLGVLCSMAVEDLL